MNLVRPLQLVAALSLLQVFGLTAAAEVRTISIGEGGDLSWTGVGSAPVDAIIPAFHRSGGDPNDLVQGNTPGNLVEIDSRRSPGSLHVLEIAQGENIAAGTFHRGGSIDAPNVFGEGQGFGFAGGLSRDALKNVVLPELLDNTEEDGPLKAFERKDIPNGVFGIIIVLDLGGRIGVNKIRFYPRNTLQSSPTTPFEDDFMRAFDLFINNGVDLTKGGNPAWKQLISEEDNRSQVVEVELQPPEVVRHVRLVSRTPINWEIDEIEIIGQGFLTEGRYVSDIFDAGQPAAWTNLRWTEKIVGEPAFSVMEIRTRTGIDESPFVFTRQLKGKSDAEEIPYAINSNTEEMDLEGYETLPPTDDLGRQWERGDIHDDLVSWSPFSSPYSENAANGPGIPIISPSPRRYFQFEVAFRSEDMGAARLLKSLSFDYATPPLADSLNAEIFPREVDLSTSTEFTYSVLAVIKSAGLTGFDTITITTASRVDEILGIDLHDADGNRIAGRNFTGIDNDAEVDGFQIVSVEDDHFALRFPRIEDNHTRIDIRFRTQVLTYSTSFGGAMSLSDTEDAFQAVTPGNAALLGEGDEAEESGTTVLSPEVLAGGKLLDQFAITPNPFSPNGDDVNDVLTVQYNLLSVTAPSPVSITVHDLSGRLVGVISDREEMISGRYRDQSWDGLDPSGNPVPPGLYIVRIEVNGDAEKVEEARLLSLAY